MRYERVGAALVIWAAACQSDGERGPNAEVVVPPLPGGALGTPRERAEAARALRAAAEIVARRRAAAAVAARSPARREREYAVVVERASREQLRALASLGVAPAPGGGGAGGGAYLDAERTRLAELEGVARAGLARAPDVASGNVLRLIADEAAASARFLTASGEEEARRGVGGRP